MAKVKENWSDGEIVDATDLNAIGAQVNNLHNNQQVAGEAIAGATAPIPVCVLSDIFQRECRAESNFGDASGNTRRSVKFIPRGAITSTTIKLFLKKVGSPTGNLTIEIQTDSAGDPSGTPVTNGTSNTVAMSGLTTAHAETTFTFGSAFSLSAGTTYHLVLKRSDAVSGSNYCKVLSITNDYASFVGKKYNGSAWSSGDLMYFEMTPATGAALSVWKSDANVIGLHWFDGFAVTTAASAGDNIVVQTNGIVRGLSGLVAGKKYFVSDTVGTISDTVGTYETGVGEAVSATELLIKKYSNEYIGSGSFSQISASTSAWSGDLVMPANAVYTLASIGGSADPNSFNAQVTVAKRGLTSANANEHTGTNTTSVSVSLSANILTLSASSNTQNTSWSCSGTAYFYR